MTMRCRGMRAPGRGGGSASMNLVAAGRQSSPGHQGCAPDLAQTKTPSFCTDKSESSCCGLLSENVDDPTMR